jgi:hypothetical protein
MAGVSQKRTEPSSAPMATMIIRRPDAEITCGDEITRGAKPVIVKFTQNKTPECLDDIYS